jgi:hypothetical protein
MPEMPTPADAETRDQRAALARAVKEELLAAGLPVTPDDAVLDSSLTAGAHVYVDRLADSGGGVCVSWKTHFVLRTAAIEALRQHRFDDPSIHLRGKVAEVMLDAMAEILTAAGFSVAKDVNDMAPFDLLVQERQSDPSWR